MFWVFMILLLWFLPRIYFPIGFFLLHDKLIHSEKVSSRKKLFKSPEALLVSDALIDASVHAITSFSLEKNVNTCFPSVFRSYLLSAIGKNVVHKIDRLIALSIYHIHNVSLIQSTRSSAYFHICSDCHCWFDSKRTGKCSVSLVTRKCSWYKNIQ